MIAEKMWLNYDKNEKIMDERLQIIMQLCYNT